MERRALARMALMLPLICLAPLARAGTADDAPETVIRRMSDEVMAFARNETPVQAGDTRATMALVDSAVMPRVNFQRMTAAAVGPAWRQATPEQRRALQQQFKLLLVRTYAGALAEIKGRTITVYPPRGAPGDPDVIVRSEVRGRGDRIDLAYRMERTGDGGWRIHDLNVLGIWLVETYRNQFAAQINARGLDGLLAALSERNLANAGSD